MPAVSGSQQRLFGMVHAYKKGKLKKAPKKIKDIAEHISDEDAEHFAKTKHKGLPDKKAEESDDKSLEKARAFVAAVKRMALKRKLNMFLVTDGASGILNNGNPAVRNAREAQIKWELEHGADPYEDWEYLEKKSAAYMAGFLSKCAELGVDGHALLKFEGLTPESVAAIMSGAEKQATARQSHPSGTWLAFCK